MRERMASPEMRALGVRSFIVISGVRYWPPVNSSLCLGHLGR